MRSEQEIRAKKEELIRWVNERGHDLTDEIAGKVYAFEYVLGERTDI